MTAIELLIYRELNQIPEQDRRKALAQAREGDFDGIELGGMAVGLLMTTAITRFALPGTLTQYITDTIASFVVSVMILFVFVGPFFIRRTRRGLHAYLQKSHRDQTVNS